MNNRARLLDVIKRSLSGPVLTEEDFDMNHVYRGIQKVVKKYDIKLHSDHIVNLDDELADRVWNAALEFLAGCGIYSKDTGRVILYSEEELRELIRLAPAEAQFGEGRDAVLEVARTPDDPRPPINQGGPVNTPCPNEYFEPIMLSYMQEPRVEMHCPVTNMTVMGMDIRTKSPLEILAAWEEVLRFKQVAKMAGRPGIYYNGVGISVSDIGQLAAGHLMGPYDGHAFGIISELKTDNTILNKLTYITMMDGHNLPYANPIFGGLGGGIEGQVVLLTAEMIALSVAFLGTTVGTTPTHPLLFISTTKDLLNFTSVAFNAISRNSKIMTRLTHTQAGGPGTKTLLYEVIASGIVAAKSGLARVQGPRGATGAISGACSGLEARFQGEVLHAAVKLSREQADEIAKLAYAKYQDDLDKKPYGKPFWEVYDVKTVQPKKEWQQMYEEVKKEAISWGLPLDQV